MSAYDKVHRAIADTVFYRIASGPSKFTLPGGDLLSLEEVHRGQVLVSLRARNLSTGDRAVRHFVVRVQEVK